jgi:hypothetical protein
MGQSNDHGRSFEHWAHDALARGASRVPAPTPDPADARFAHMRTIAPVTMPVWAAAAVAFVLVVGITVGVSVLRSPTHSGAPVNNGVGAAVKESVSRAEPTVDRSTASQRPREGSPPALSKLDRTLACDRQPIAAPAGAAPIWCGPALVDTPATFSNGANRWADDFGGTVGPAAIADRQDRRFGYYVYDSVGGKVTQTAAYRSHNGWGTDVCCAGDYGGTMVRPDRSFQSVGGTFAVEADVATPDSYGTPGASAWPELAVSTEDHPTDQDNVYAGYGNFGRGYTVGCDLMPSRSPICYLFQGKDKVWTAGSTAQDAATVTGGGPWNGLEKAWRTCPASADIDTCLNRFRLELTSTRLTLFVNGVMYMQATFRSGMQLPPALFAGPLYAYCDSFVYRPSSVVLFRWKYVSINP